MNPGQTPSISSCSNRQGKELGWFVCVAVRLNGRFALSDSGDHTLIVWAWQTGQRITTWRAGEPLRACAVAPDSVTIIVGGASDRVHFLRLEEVNNTNGK